MNWEKRFFQMELALKVLTGELELWQTEYRRHDQPTGEWTTCVLGPKEWNFDLVEYRRKPDKGEVTCLCRYCRGNDTEPCNNAERERDRQWIIDKLNKRIEEQQLLLDGANATCAKIGELVGDRGQYRDLVEAVTIKFQTIEAQDAGAAIAVGKGQAKDKIDPKRWAEIIQEGGDFINSHFGKNVLGRDLITIAGMIRKVEL